MIDVGLLLSMVAAIGVPTIALRWWPMRSAAGGSFADLTALAALAGLLVGRLVNVALDAPASFGRIGDLLIIRSGVEFWPGGVGGHVDRRVRGPPSGCRCDRPGR